MSVSPIANPQPAYRPAWSIEDDVPVIAKNMADATVNFADRNRDGVLGRDEFKGSQYDRLDADRNGLTREELTAGLSTLNYSTLNLVIDNVLAGVRSDEDHQMLRHASKLNLGVAGLGALVGTAIFGATAWVLAPAAAIAAMAVFTWHNQHAKDLAARDRATQYVNDTLEGMGPTPINYRQLTSPLASQVEDATRFLAMLITAPIEILKALYIFLLLFFTGI